MSYFQLRQIKAIELLNGNIVLLQRGGCNNDDEGRKKDEYNIITIKSIGEYEQEINKYKSNSKPYKEIDGGYWDLQIYGKPKNDFDYGKAIERAINKRINVKDVGEKYSFFGSIVTAIYDVDEMLEKDKDKCKNYLDQERDWSKRYHYERKFYFNAFEFFKDIKDTKHIFTLELRPKKNF